MIYHLNYCITIFDSVGNSKYSQTEVQRPHIITSHSKVVVKRCERLIFFNSFKELKFLNGPSNRKSEM